MPVSDAEPTGILNPVTVDRPDFSDPRATVAPLLAVADLARALTFWVGQVGGVVEVQWDTYALIRIGAGRLHLAVAGEPPPDRAVRLAPPQGDGSEATGEVVIGVADCRAVVDALRRRGVAFLGPPASPAWGGELRAFCRDPDGHLVEISSPD